MAVSDCSPLLGNKSSCPISLQARSNALPTNGSESEVVDCASRGIADCHVTVAAPGVQHWQYISIVRQTSDSLNLTLQLTAHSEYDFENVYINP